MLGRREITAAEPSEEKGRFGNCIKGRKLLPADQKVIGGEWFVAPHKHFPGDS